MSNNHTQQAIFEEVMARGGSLEECKAAFARKWKDWEQFVTMAHTAPDRG